jgi:putative membrane protein
MKQYLGVLLKGICMGAADVVPGVSGGTMALILGIYERLLLAIRHFDFKLFRLVFAGRITDAARHIDLGFVAALGMGIACAILFFTRIVPLPTLITTHPELIYGLFFGLVAASIAILLIQQAPLRMGKFAYIVFGAALGLILVNLVPQQTPTASWFIALCGAIAISAMILPGISGSFILLILQKYAFVFDAIGRLDFSVIAPFAFGCGCGLLVFSRFLSWLLRRFNEATMLTIIGVLIGSLWIIWPFQHRVYETIRGKQRLIHSSPNLPQDWDLNVLSAFVLAVAGVALVITIHSFSSRQR